MFEAHGNREMQEGQREALHIPDTMTTWPWVRSVNPLQLEDEVTSEAIAWATQFRCSTQRLGL